MLSTPRARTALATVASLLVLGLLGTLLVVWSGAVSIAASSGHFAVTRWFLTLAMRNAVETQSYRIVAPANLDDPDLVALGAGHFLAGCAPCHGAPGDHRNAVVRHMVPDPPRLESRVGAWRDRELFWIVKHGIKYTGMPAWSGAGRDDEVWAMVAFLRQLPRLDAAAYRSLTEGNARAGPPQTVQFVSSGQDGPSFLACSRCHDTGTEAPTSSLVPRLAGQKERYLALSLRAYASGARQSGVMETIATELDEADIADLAAYYASLEPAILDGSEKVGGSADIELGARLATAGDFGAGIPPCVACHNRTTSDAYPILNGQPAPYLARQLELWRSETRSSTALGAIMTTIARRMNDRQIAAVAAYFARQPQLDRSAVVTVRPAGQAAPPQAVSP